MNAESTLLKGEYKTNPSGKKKLNYMSSNKNNKIWIDLDNSPHVPFFRPIIKELEKKGYRVIVTARDCFQVCGLLELFGLSYKKIGRHYGKNKILKIIGTFYRSLQLLSIGIHEKPSLSISHGSRSQLISASMLRITTVVISDYEYTQKVGFIKPKWKIVPDVILNNDRLKLDRNILSYPGLKEDVYATDFKPNSEIRKKLGLREKDLLATIRPPATEAHYHNPESDKLFIATVEFLGLSKDVRMVILPRNEIKQTEFVKKRWAKWCNSGKIIIPKHVINGLDLIYASDFVVSGGGTMNREAAALGVPVYSIFRGKIGAVDQYLSDSGRLTLIKSVEEIERKIKIAKRLRLENPEYGNRNTLEKIIDNIITIVRTI